MNASGSVSSGAKFTLPVPSLSEVSINRVKMLFLERSCCWQSGTERAGSGLRIGQGPTLAQRPDCDVPLWEEEEEEEKEEAQGRRLCWSANVQASMKLTLWQAPNFSRREQINSFEGVVYGGWTLCISPTGYVCLHIHSYVWCFIEAGYGRVVSWAPDNTGFLSAWISLFCRASWPPGELCMSDETTSVSHSPQSPYKTVKHVKTLSTTQ